MPALENVQSLITLDIYDHDISQASVKSIACDDNTRYVAAQLTEQGVPYYLPSDANVTLTVLRPDQAGVGITGSTFAYTIFEEDTEETVYGAYAELDQAAIALSGTLYAQFKITVGSQILRTEIFKIDNGRALDAEISDWSGTYNSYNLDELVEQVEFILSAIQNITGDDVDIEGAIAATHNYIDLQIAMLQANVDQKIESVITVHDNGIYITTQ